MPRRNSGIIGYSPGVCPDCSPQACGLPIGDSHALLVWASLVVHEIVNTPAEKSNFQNRIWCLCKVSNLSNRNICIDIRTDNVLSIWIYIYICVCVCMCVCVCVCACMLVSQWHEMPVTRASPKFSWNTLLTASGRTDKFANHCIWEICHNA